jgi:hypothetical protein
MFIVGRQILLKPLPQCSRERWVWNRLHGCILLDRSLTNGGAGGLALATIQATRRVAGFARCAPVWTHAWSLRACRPRRHVLHFSACVRTFFFLTERGLEGPRSCFITTPDLQPQAWSEPAAQRHGSSQLGRMPCGRRCTASASTSPPPPPPYLPSEIEPCSSWFGGGGGVGLDFISVPGRKRKRNGRRFTNWMSIRWKK